MRRQCCLVLVSFLHCFEMMASLGVLFFSHRLHSLCKEVVAGKGAFELPSLGITLPIWRWIVIIVNMWVEHHYHHSWLQKVTHHCKHPKEKKNWQTLDKGKKALSSFFVNEFPYLFFLLYFQICVKKHTFWTKESVIWTHVRLQNRQYYYGSFPFRSKHFRQTPPLEKYCVLLPISAIKW